MCGRYYVDDETAREIEKLVRRVDGRLRRRTGDIRPSEQAALICCPGQEVTACAMRWGFPNFSGNGLLINARAETVREKKTFRDSVRSRRCLIPARGFYEWDKEKNKVGFERSDRKTLYMAGIWRTFEEENRFVILTTRANASVSGVHGRMPLILEPEELERWLTEEESVEFILNREPGALSALREYEQASLPF